MSEKTKPTQEQVFLLEEARKKKQEASALEASINEARTHVPELKVKVEELLGIPPVQPKVNMTQEQVKEALENRLTKPNMGNIMNEINLDLGNEWVYFHNSYVVLGASVDNSVKVDVFKGLGRDGGRDYNNDDITIVIPDLGMKLILPDKSNNASIESTHRGSEPFTMHTTIGAPVKSWPLWKRDMTMEDYKHFDALLDRLTQSDVEKTEVKRPTRRTR
ncbi:MAG: hypothetical protein KBC00_01810 [Candidatus Levybacteria bacterium]|nr:hypothetical protein [Candidatus Levybacteria bacterium]MBP9815059.1 hypothetical protein [Candidatus Levybacteria bacterium]